MTTSIKKAVFPVAGLGTRFLPATKAVAKEMLPVVDRPLIQYAVDEALEAGIEEFIFVVGEHNQPLIETHFGVAPRFEQTLKERGKTDELKALQKVSLDALQMHFVHQDQPLGLGHAVWCARKFIGDDAFAVILPDDLIQANPGCLAQMMEVHNVLGGNVIAVEDVPRDQTARYGILDVAEDDGRIALARGMVEKPAPEDAPSTLSVIGRYLLEPQVLAHLEKGEKGAGDEIQLTDAIAAVIETSAVRGLRFEGRRFDCGEREGFVIANVAFALARDDLSPELTLKLAETLKSLG